MPTIRGRIRPPRRVTPPVPPTTLPDQRLDLSTLRGSIHKHADDLADRAELLSDRLHRLATLLRQWDKSWRDYPHFNSIGEVQAEGGVIDNLCGRLWVELELFAFIETGDPLAVYNWRRAQTFAAMDPSSSGPG